jgi:AraC family transcriptional regulator of adaptative response/methylated-DNA-[protein]-cysteine methyltransferase
MSNTTLPRFATDGQKWNAVRRRDTRADGVFVFSVKTTGVYCRPSCPSRPPRRDNVAFHSSCAGAERAGFRPCKRCQPHTPGLAAIHSEAVARACRILEERDPAPALAELAREVGMSPSHFHRVFLKIAGTSPKAYLRARRAADVRGHLRRGARVTEAVYAAGYSSSGRFYADAAHELGMKPKAYRLGGRGESIRYSLGTCSLGRVLAAATAKGICSILLGDEPRQLVRDLHARFPHAVVQRADRRFAQTLTAVIARIDDPRSAADLPLDLRGTLFQQKVWRALTEIPPGRAASYSELARRIGRPRAVRAVASACAANPLAVAIPCHRAVRADGSLAGYRWGLKRKQALLQREAE